MSYGAQVAYPNGLSMRDGQQVDSGFILKPGTYTIDESIPAGWQLTININDPSGDSSSSSNQATINLAAGETVIVTYINYEAGISPTSTSSTTPTGSAGRIVLKTQIVPYGTTGHFDFTMSYGKQVGYPNGVRLWTSDSGVDSGFSLSPGIYTINEMIPTGWELTIEINDPSDGSSSIGSQATINLAAGETVIVNYINSSTGVSPTSIPSTTPAGSAGRIILKTQVVSGATNGTFEFTMSYGSQIGYPNGVNLDASFPEIDSGFSLSPGMYTISETVPTEWQTTIEINDPSDDSSSSGSQITINLAAGETVIITYINSKAGTSPTTTPSPTSANSTGRIVLKTQIVPGGISGLFDFTMSYGGQVGYPDGVSLGSSNPEVDSGFSLPPGIYTIDETVPLGWQLTINISDPGGNSSSSGARTTIDLATGETVIATYINTKTNVTPTLTPGPTTTGNPGRIILRKQIVSISGAGPFYFIMSYGSQVGYPDGANLDTSFLEIDSGFILAPGIYHISETLPTGWTLTININDPSGGSSSAGNQTTIDLAAGETVTVTYTNTKTG
jgi:hypothetical protein